MKTKDSFVLYTSMLKSTKKLSLEQKGKLFEVIIEYQTTGEVPEIDDLAVEVYFDLIKNQMDLDDKKFQETIEKRREAGRKGGKAKKANEINEVNEKENLTNESNVKQNEAKKANANFAKQTKLNENENVNENVNIKEKEKYKKEKEKSTSDFQTFVKVWNESAEKFNLPKVEKLSKERERKLKRRLKDNKEFLEDFKRALEEIKFSSFLRGENKNNWKMKFDWLIENNTNIVKVIEGQYRDTIQERNEEPVILYHY